MLAPKQGQLLITQLIATNPTHRRSKCDEGWWAPPIQILKQKKFYPSCFVSRLTNLRFSQIPKIKPSGLITKAVAERFWSKVYQSICCVAAAGSRSEPRTASGPHRGLGRGAWTWTFSTKRTKALKTNKTSELLLHCWNTKSWLRLSLVTKMGLA